MMRTLMVIVALSSVAACVEAEIDVQPLERVEIVCVAWPCCGDGVCDGGETEATCPRDCPIVCSTWPCCGDGVCDGGESCATCAADCGCPPGASCSLATGADTDADAGAACVVTEDARPDHVDR